MSIFVNSGKIYLDNNKDKIQRNSVVSRNNQSSTFSNSSINIPQLTNGGALAKLQQAQAEIDSCSSCSGSKTNDTKCKCLSDDDCSGYCCCEECQINPCRSNCDEFDGWTLSASFCEQTLVWSTDSSQNNGLSGSPFRLNWANGYLCTARAGGYGWNCGNYPPELTLDPECYIEGQDGPVLNPNGKKCVGRLEILATGPVVGGGSFCVRAYQADIVNGELVNIVRPITSQTGGVCDCQDGEEIQVSLSYNPLP